MELGSSKTTLEECVDDLSDYVDALDRYPPSLLALAMRIHLEVLLQNLLEAGTCTREQVREFVTELLEVTLEG